MSAPDALPAAQLLIRLLVTLNWLLGLAVLLLLTTTFVDPAWALRAITSFHGDAAQRLLVPLQVVAGLGLGSIPINDLILRRLLAIVQSVRQGNAFAAANAGRLQAIGWALLALQLIGGLIWLIANGVSSPGHAVDLDAGFSAAGWLAVLLSFVLARVFEEGTRMQDDIEGTV